MPSLFSHFLAREFYFRKVLSKRKKNGDCKMLFVVPGSSRNSMFTFRYPRYVIYDSIYLYNTITFIKVSLETTSLPTLFVSKVLCHIKGAKEKVSWQN